MEGNGSVLELRRSLSSAGVDMASLGKEGSGRKERETSRFLAQTTSIMFRNVLLRSTRALPRVATPTYRPTALRLSPFRAYSASALSSEDITSRILDVLKSFEKVDPAKVSLLVAPDAVRSSTGAPINRSP